MNELLFALLGAAVVFLVLVPVATLLAKGLLVWRRRRAASDPTDGSATTYLLIVGPGLGSVLWLASAAFHQSEPLQAPAACAFSHVETATCLDALLFALAILGATAWALGRHLRQDRSSGGKGKRHDPRTSQARRLASLAAEHPELSGMADRFRAVSGAAHPICTRGIFHPMVHVDIAFMDRLDDAALRAAMLHEGEHRRGLDPFRYLLASVSLSLNPASALLRGELQRWRAGREAACDEAALVRSADPLALAQALVVAARSRPAPAGLGIALGGQRHAGLLQLRVQRLLERGGAPPARRGLRAPRTLGLAVAVIALVALPHLFNAWPLDSLHAGLERALAHIGLI